MRRAGVQEIMVGSLCDARLPALRGVAALYDIELQFYEGKFDVDAANENHAPSGLGSLAAFLDVDAGYEACIDAGEQACFDAGAPRAGGLLGDEGSRGVFFDDSIVRGAVAAAVGCDAFASSEVTRGLRPLPENARPLPTDTRPPPANARPRTPDRAAKQPDEITPGRRAAWFTKGALRASDAANRPQQRRPEAVCCANWPRRLENAA
ncbi:hypothetical protein M885DRAFT_539333 [Pelagophyceae sp. CCMP2097]|nr:hypothetical protein M885DRAFT_539333 [Pelagophyceae sp. CCMP2097]